MRMMKISVAYILVLLSVCCCVQAQDLDRLMESYNTKVPQEKVYIQFDNSAYMPGQTVWYKAYLQQGNRPSAISTNLYINWYDHKGVLLGHLVAPVFESTASGNFTIPASFPDKDIRVVAYTKWMLNFDSAFLFRKTLFVAQKPVTVKKEANNPNTRVTLGFYPEGGEMIDNIPSVVAFKAVNAAGMPVCVSGIITDKAQQKIASFRSTHDGMGKVLLTPVPGEMYTARWDDPEGIPHSTQLPIAKSTGVVLKVDNTTATRLITIERTAAADKRLEKLTLVATMNQQVLFSGVANLQNREKLQTNIPTDRFPSGVLRLTVLDALQQPVAERVLFINNYEYKTGASLQTDTLDFGKRAKNVYQLTLPDSLVASVSVAVTDGYDQPNASGNIVSGLLLSSEVKGIINDPAYYFSSVEDSVAEQLDLVMLTNGWRHFLWQDVLTGKRPALRLKPDTAYLSIAASVSGLREGKIKRAKLMNMMLVSKDSSKQFLFAPLQPDGSFRQDNLILFDTTEIYFRLNNNTNIPWMSKVKLENNFLSVDPAARLSRLPDAGILGDTTGTAQMLWLKAEQARMDALRRKSGLADVTVYAKTRTRMEILDDRHTTGMFKNAGNAYQFNILDDHDAQTFPDIFTYLQGRLPGVNVKRSGPLGEIQVVRMMRTSFYGGDTRVPVYLNEVLIPDNEIVKSIPVSAIAYVKLIPPPFVDGAGGGPGGALAVYTVSGADLPELARNTPSMNLDRAEITGYTPVREFYSPDYSQTTLNVDEKDLRRTLLWQPDIYTDGTQNSIPVSFYNNDYSRSFHVVVEGMTAGGKLIHIEKKIQAQ
jgi:hypothetical protein